MACLRCGGTGVLVEYSHHQGGICFRCRGSGRDPNSTNLFKPDKVHKEITIAGRKVVLTTRKDLKGRFMGYCVYVEGQQQVNCRNFKEANETFKKVAQQVKHQAKFRNANF